MCQQKVWIKKEENLSMELPKLKGRKWYLAVNTDHSASKDIIEPKQQQVINENSIEVYSNSIVVCESR